ncbi:MAG: SUMF1/EgtB/PvdO family nonheme iron enzyme [Desulfamplus sp.]|nr:SUMF1/EgtB/PvdO family nonheme iron enzyme [Desulfamplus sp.]
MPVGPGTGSYRVIRGGSWFYVAQYCRSAFRDWNYPSYWLNDLGFRLVCSAGHQ